MRRTAIKALAAAFAFAVTAACSSGSAEPTEEVAQQQPEPSASKPNCTPGDTPPAFGLLTSLPIYWSLDQSIEDFARGNAETTWQRAAIEQCYSIVPLDTLSPIAGLGPDDPETDPLADLERLAVIQPRGLSPADNVALDEWVRAGGHLLLVLDPMLTGHYELPLGSPRRPADSALIPPVVKRWGLAVNFDDEQELALQEAELDGGHLWLSLPGNVAQDDAQSSSCQLFANKILARCQVEKGSVTLLADAASFEHAPDEVENSMAKEPPLLTVLRFAFKPETNVLNAEKRKAR